MSRIPKWKIEKTKVKVVFRLQFHATHVPLQGWDKLFVSFIPMDTGKAIAKTNKVNVKNGNCKWPDPIYETTRLLQDTRTKAYDEKLYKLVVATGSSRSSCLGEVNINLADFAGALKPSSLSLPLTNCDCGTILHITVQLLTSKTGFREFEQQREQIVKGIQMISNPGNDRSHSEAASSEIASELAEKVNSRVRFKEDCIGIPSFEQVEELNADYEDSAGGVDSSSFTSDSLYAEKNDLQIMQGMDNFKNMFGGDPPLSQSHMPGNRDPIGNQFSNQGRSDWSHGWNSVDNSLATVHEENSRLRVRLEVAESAFLQLKLEAKSLQRVTDELGAETQSLSKQLSVELDSGEQLTREVSLLKSECSKFRCDLETLKSAKVLQQSSEQRAHIHLMPSHGQEHNAVGKLHGDAIAAETHYMYHDLRVKWLESLMLIEGKVHEIHNKACLQYHASDFDFLGPDFELLGCVIGDLKEDIIQVKGLERSYGDNKHLGGTVHLSSDSHTVYCEYDALKKNVESSSFKGDNVFNLLSKLEDLTTEKESLAKKMDQMQCYYESLILELEESQKQTVKELDNLRNEHSSCLYSISVLQNQIQKSHQEMKEQFMAYAENKNNLESQNKELERRAIASENALKRVRWNYSIAVDRLQKDLELLSFQVLSMYETNENLAKQTLADACQHYIEECPEETSTCNVKDGTFTLIDQEHNQSGGTRGQTENGPNKSGFKWSSMENGLATSVYCNNRGVSSQVGLPLHVQLQTKDEAHVDGICPDKSQEQASHYTQVKEKLTVDLSPGTRGDEVLRRSTAVVSKLDTQSVDNAEATENHNQYAGGVEELRKPLHMLKVLHSGTEAELLEVHMLNMNLKVFSEVILGTWHDAKDGFHHMKEKMVELSQQLLHTTEVKESLMLKLHKALDDSRILIDDKAKYISRCEDLTMKNQILEAKLQDVSDESIILCEKVVEYERMLAEFIAHEKEYKICIEERDKLKNMLKEESLQKSCLQIDLSSTIENFNELKEELENKSCENGKMQICIADIKEKLVLLQAHMTGCIEQINCCALGEICKSQQVEAGNYMAIITSAEHFQQEATKEILQLHQDKMDMKEQKDIALSSLSKAELEYTNMKQKLESDLSEITEKLGISNALVEKLQLELQNALVKLKINSDAEEKNGLQNTELSSKLTILEIQLQQTIEENKDLVNQLVALASVKVELERTQISLKNFMQEKSTLLMSIESKNDACSQMENEFCSLKKSLQFTQRDMEIEKSKREELDAAVASLSVQLEEKDKELLLFYEQKAKLAHLQDVVADLEKTNTEFQNLLLASEGSKRTLERENLSLQTQAMDTGNQLEKVLHNSIAAEIRATFIKSNLFDRMHESFAQIKKLEKELAEMNLKHKNVVTLVDTYATKESHLVEENAIVSEALQSLKSDYDIIFKEKENLLELVNMQNAVCTEFEDLKVRALTIEGDSCHQKQKYEDEICQLKGMLIGCEEELYNLRSSRDALEVTNMVLQSKLNEEQEKISLLDDCNHRLKSLQEQHNELGSKLSEQISKTEEYKNLSIHLKELKDKAEAECLLAREKKENERLSQESLRIAFIKEQYESKIQELKNQSYVSKKYTEEMLFKLQNALDEVESRKKIEVSLAKKIDELLEKISNIESELDTALNDRRELVESFDRIKHELKCTILNLDCCKQEKLVLENSLKECNEEKLNLEDSLKECNEERTKARIELDLVKSLFDSMASNVAINSEDNNDSCSPTTTSIEQILQDGSFGFSVVFQDMMNDRGSDLGIFSSSGSVANTLENRDPELQKTGNKLSSCPLPSSLSVQDAECGDEQKTSFADNITDITNIEEHFKEQQRLKSGIDMLHKELEKLRNENLSSLIPLEDHQSVPSLQVLERNLSQLDLANEHLGSIFPSFKELPGSGNPLERVLALELELAESLQTKKSDLQFQSSFLKQHNDEEAVFQSFRDINDLLKEMLELKSRNAAFETELKDMHSRYSQLSLQFAEVEGERQKLMMTLKTRVPTKRS